MRAKICWVIGELEDSMIIEAVTIEQLQKIADAEIEKRKPDNFWSEWVQE